MEISIFTVLPSGKQFRTSDLSVPPRGDKDGAYDKAHRHAARQAAKGVESWVVRDDTGTQQRYGFGPNAILTPSTILHQIVQLCLPVLWDPDSISWVPLAEVSEEVEDRASMTRSKT